MGWSHSPTVSDCQRPFGIITSKRNYRKEGKAKVFFSEEKKQKTFMFGASGKIPAMASILGAAGK